MKDVIYAEATELHQAAAKHQSQKTQQNFIENYQDHKRKNMSIVDAKVTASKGT